VKRFKKPSDIKVGTIGYGGAFNMGRKHLEEMQKAGMTPVCVAEIDASRLEVARVDFPGIETYTSVRKMLTRSAVDLLAIITPHNTHADLTMHGFRHYATSEMENERVSEAVSSVILGHTRGDVHDEYFHKRISLLKEAVDKIR